MSLHQISSVGVFTKKLNKAVYHLASFNEPLTQQACARLPAHIIEEDLPETQDSLNRDLFATASQFVRHHNRVGSDFSEIGKKKSSNRSLSHKTMLTYEESIYTEES